jgi:hypothetical protein
MENHLFTTLANRWDRELTRLDLAHTAVSEMSQTNSDEVRIMDIARVRIDTQMALLNQNLFELREAITNS